MSSKIQFTGYRTAHLQIYNWLMYTHIIIQTILEKKNKSKYIIILKIRFHVSIRVAEGSNDRLLICIGACRSVEQ